MQKYKEHPVFFTMKEIIYQEIIDANFFLNFFTPSLTLKWQTKLTHVYIFLPAYIRKAG